MTERTDRVSEIGQRLTQATPGPWASYLGELWYGVTATELARADRMAAEHDYSDEVEDIFDRSGHLFYGDVKRAEDAVFIAAAPDDIRWLLAEVARLSADIERVQAVHQPSLPGLETRWCKGCENLWPCPTIRALSGDTGKDNG